MIKNFPAKPFFAKPSVNFINGDNSLEPLHSEKKNLFYLKFRILDRILEIFIEIQLISYFKHLEFE